MPFYRWVAVVIALALVLSLAGGCKSDSDRVADESTYDGIRVGLTAEGYVYIGSPDAWVSLHEYADFLCPYNARHVSQVEPSLIEQYVRTGQVQLIFRDNPISSLHPTSRIAHEAAFCVSRQDAAFFWTMYRQLFAEQAQWGQLRDPADYLSRVAVAIGADTDEYTECLQSGAAKASVDATLAEAQSYGYLGTPISRLRFKGSEQAYTVRGSQPLETFNDYIDALLGGWPPPGELPVRPEEEPVQPEEKPTEPDDMQRAGAAQTLSS
jgi:protein-disulfide isomerase